MHRRLITALVAILLAFALVIPSALADDSVGLISRAARATATATDKATPEPDKPGSATAVPTIKPVSSTRPTATAKPTATSRPTAKPTATPTAAPTEEPTIAPTAIPTLEPQPTATPLPLPLREDDRGDLVKQIQTRLRELGFLNDTADGIFGPNTLKAVKAFQEFVYEYLSLELHYIDPNATPEPTAEPTPTPEPTKEPTPTPTEAPTERPTATPSLAPGESAAPGTPVPATAAPATSTPAPTPALPTATPYVADGIVDEQGYALLTGDDFPAYISDLEKGAEGTDVRRLQTRLTTLYYLTDGIDGIFGSNTQSAVKYFQKHNDLEQTGIADEQTQLKLYSSDAVPTAKPTLQPASRDSKGNGKSYSKYKLVIDVSDQRVYAYGYENGAYGPLARVMVCSTGTKSDPTPLGTYTSTERLGKWYYFTKFKCWAQYAYRITGPYYFHSVLFNNKGDSKPTSSSVRNLGKRASHGCVRLSVEDAKWIYNNCDAGTTVVVRE